MARKKVTSKKGNAGDKSGKQDNSVAADVLQLAASIMKKPDPLLMGGRVMGVRFVTAAERNRGSHHRRNGRGAVELPRADV